MASIWSYHRGLDLDKDPQFQAKLKDPAQYNYIYGSSATTLDKKISKEAKISVYIFLIALGLIVIFAVFPSLLPLYTNSEGLPTRLKMNLVIQIVMLGAAALMVICAKANPKLAVSGAVWQSGMVAVVAIFGIAWMADTYFEAYTENIKVIMSGLVESYPWSIAFVFFFVSVLINSQGAVVVSMLPLAYSMGIDGVVLLGVFPSVYGYFFIPNYPSDIATVNFDRSGTTVIGKYLFNHSFMIPGLINVITATIVASILAQIFHGFGWV
jgi:anaerobic C4-dicarboxylate transporter DcuB